MSTPNVETAATVVGFTAYAEWRCPVCNTIEFCRTRRNGEQWKSRPCAADKSHTPWPSWMMGSHVMLKPSLATWAEVVAFVDAKAEAAGQPKPRPIIPRQAYR